MSIDFQQTKGENEVEVTKRKVNALTLANNKLERELNEVHISSIHR